MTFMLHAFNIYPALFVITPTTESDTIVEQHQESSWVAENDRYFTCCPQTYWGDCIFQADTKQLMVCCRNDARPCPVQEKINGKINLLEPAKFKGARYTITYIPVLN
jgi:hypothetical protein